MERVRFAVTCQHPFLLKISSLKNAFLTSDKRLVRLTDEFCCCLNEHMGALFVLERSNSRAWVHDGAPHDSLHLPAASWFASAIRPRPLQALLLHRFTVKDHAANKVGHDPNCKVADTGPLHFPMHCRSKEAYAFYACRCIIIGQESVRIA